METQNQEYDCNVCDSKQMENCKISAYEEHVRNSYALCNYLFTGYSGAIAQGIPLAISAGLPIGLVFENPLVGICAGISAGCFGAALVLKGSKADEEQENLEGRLE